MGLLRAQCIWGLRKPTTKKRGDFSSKAMVHVTPDHKEARASPPHLTGAGRGCAHRLPAVAPLPAPPGASPAWCPHSEHPSTLTFAILPPLCLS